MSNKVILFYDFFCGKQKNFCGLVFPQKWTYYILYPLIYPRSRQFAHTPVKASSYPSTENPSAETERNSLSIEGENTSPIAPHTRQRTWEWGASVASNRSSLPEKRSFFAFPLSANPPKRRNTVPLLTVGCFPRTVS